MQQIAIVSGKGGTGKTMLTSSFAALADNAVFVDCDVDAANLHILLHPDVQEEHDFVGGSTASVDTAGCTACGKCAEVCRFDAILDGFQVDDIACEGCGFCAHVCPESAIQMKSNVCGKWFVSSTKYGCMVHARLGVGEDNSGKLVTKIRKVAEEKSQEHGTPLVLIDGPPGIGCPAIASLSGVDVAVVVTEPTVSGLHDLERVLGLTQQFKTHSYVVINKCDLAPRTTDRIHALCNSRGIQVLGEVPFSVSVARSLVQTLPHVEATDDEAAMAMRTIWERIMSAVAQLASKV